MYFDATEFAARLSTLRKVQGMTQEELSEALNISLEHLSKMERGKRKPSIDLIIAMACYFRVSTDYLLMGEQQDGSCIEEAQDGYQYTKDPSSEDSSGDAGRMEKRSGFHERSSG